MCGSTKRSKRARWPSTSERSTRSCTVHANDALEIIPRLPTLYDEPFADPSQIPTALVCGMTRRHVTVALSGDGGDELFGGYRRYLRMDALWGAASRVPRPMRRLAGKAIGAIPRSWGARMEAGGSSAELGTDAADVLRVRDVPRGPLPLAAPE